jgi:phage gp45-like
MDGSARWGELVKVSNDKGPFKMIRVQSDGHEVSAKVIEPYGVQGSPVKDSIVLMFPLDGDEGKMVALVMPPPAKRTDQQKPGEVSYVNHDTGNAMKHDADGTTTTTTKKDHVVKAGSDGRINTGGILYINC